MFKYIPIVNAAELDSEQGIAYLREICQEVGFFYLSNHGVPQSLMQRMLNLSQQFFNLSLVEKEALAISNSPHFRGYGRLNAEITQGIPDHKETYDLGLENTQRYQQLEKPYYILQGPNQWPTVLPSFKETVLDYLQEMQKLGYQIMYAIANSLGLSLQQMDDLFNPNSSYAYALLRLLRYPPSQEKFGVGPHTDAGFLVFLLQDNVGGLQVQNSSGEWISVPPRENYFVVNSGEMLEVWSQGRYKATAHRVLNNSLVERYSVPFFYEPHLNANIHGVKYGKKIWQVFRRSYPGS